MDTAKKKSHTLKFRVTESEYEIILKQVTAQNTTVSEVLRNSLFKGNNDIGNTIRDQFILQNMYNLIQHTQMPKSSRNSLIQEINRYGKSWN